MELPYKDIKMAFALVDQSVIKAIKKRKRQVAIALAERAARIAAISQFR